MPRRVKGPDGKIHAFPDDATDDEIGSALQGMQTPPQSEPSTLRKIGSTIADVGIGALKGAGSTIAGLGELAVNAGAVPGVTPAPFNPVFRHPIFTRAEEATRATNTPQMVGKVLEAVAELAVPTGQAVKAIPSTAKAGKLFQEIKAVAKDIPVNLSAPGDVALRIADLAQRGGGSNWGPAPVRQFIQWATDPKKEPMTYEIAKDFASNISRLSADEMRKLPPAIGREVHGLRVSLNKAVGEAAARAGKGQDYVKAMNDYAKAKRLQDTFEAVKQGAVAAVPKVAAAAGLGGAGAAGYWAYKHLLGGD